MIDVRNSVPGAPVDEAVFFPFDNVSVPFSHGLQMYMAAGKPIMGSRNPVVLSRGEPGEPDDVVARFYGTVLQMGDELRMYYLARGTLDEERGDNGLRLCYAVSHDGLNWEKPKLGLVEYNGSKENNIVDLMEGRCLLGAAPIIFDPHDPNPERRFKIAFESGKYENSVAVAWSADGLRWTEFAGNPVAQWLEQSGLIRYKGYYYVNGQGGAHPGVDRMMVTCASYDFEQWSPSSCMSFRRGNLWPQKTETTWNTGEEVHLGAGLWDRGNVVLGVYGMWHGHPSGDRGLVVMDLGLIISHDAMHFHEPAPGFRLIPAYEERECPPGRGPSIAQGQGMLNVGDKTMCWYELWGLGNIRVATWPRDRLGWVESFWRGQGNHIVTCPVAADGEARVYVNADRLSEHGLLTVELMDEGFRPIPGYSGDACIPVSESGLRQQVRWRDSDVLQGIEGPFRLKVTFGGLRPEDPRLYAVYVTG